MLAMRRGTLGGPGYPHGPLSHRRHQGGRLRAVLAVALLLFVSMLGAAVIAGGATIAGTVEALSANLPDPALLLNLTYSQPTIVYDRTGKIELARFQQENRRTVTFEELPHLVLDATTTAEDRSFWQNSGFDPAAIVSALAGNAARIRGQKRWSWAAASSSYHNSRGKREQRSNSAVMRPAASSGWRPA